MYCISVKYRYLNSEKDHYGYIGINSSDRATFSDALNSATDPLKLFLSMHEAENYWKEWKHIFSNMILLDAQIVELTLTEKVDLLIEY